jgi:methylamine utilization protein MauJ
MYASNLQELLFHCSECSDISPQAFAEFTERFNALRNYGHLPKAREQRKYLLTPTQVALAILGLVPTRPSWAGHAATVLRTFSPVGGPKAGFHNTASLIEALVLLLTDASAREGLITARVILGSMGVNSTGGASFTYEQGGVRRDAFFTPCEAVSLTQDGAESSFDFERRLLSLASREMRFGKPFFERIAEAMEIAAIHPGEPAGDGSEYEDEEAKQARWKKLGVTRHSAFLNMRTDNYVTWPSEPTLVKFDGYHFVLMPGTKDNVQSIHLDLRANKLDDGKATTVIRRFLSIMAWCDDNFATLGFGWSGSPVPVPITKHELGFQTAPNYIFDRKIPSRPEAQRALALYREALNAERNALISYAVLNYYKIIELTQRDRGPTKNWFRDNFAHARLFESLKPSLDDFDKLRGTAEPHEYIYKSCRVAVAHAGKDSNSDPDDASELRRLHAAADIMQVLARYCIETEFKISDCMFDGT